MNFLVSSMRRNLFIGQGPPICTPDLRKNSFIPIVNRVHMRDFLLSQWASNPRIS